MTFQLTKILHEMGLFGRLIALFLAMMAVASLGVLFERLLYFARERARALGFARTAATLLEQHSYAALATEGEQQGAGLFARLTAAGLRVFLRATSRARSAVAPAELVRRELERRRESDEQEIRRGLSLLATVGSIAPFVGLLGTVVGIITAFQGIAKEGSGGLGAVSSGIAEALVETAFGLLVAIPAVLAFNHLSGRADALSASIDRARGELVDALELDAPELALHPDSRAHRNGEAISAA